MGFVGDNDDVAAVAEDRVLRLVFVEGEFLDGRKNDAAGLARGEFGAKFLAAVGLLGGLFEEFLGAVEGFVELAVEIVAVGNAAH